MAETATAPEPSPFAAALDKAFASAPAINEPGDAPPEKKEAPKEPKQETPKAPDAGDKKTATPRELFKKPEPEKKVETPPEPKSAVDQIAPPDFKGDKKAENAWTAIKGEATKFEGLAKTHEQRAKELEAKLAEYEPLKTQLAEREAKLKEYDEIVARARIEEHPEFRKEFVDGREKLMTSAKTIVEESGGDPKAIETALNLKGKARVDALEAISENLGKFQSGRLGRVIDELTDLDDRAQVKRDKAKESYKQLQEQDQQRKSEETARRAQTRAAEFDETTRRLSGELEVLKHADGHDEWNARADRIVREAKAFVNEHPNADIEAEILSRAVPAYRDLFIQADARAEAAEKKAAEMEKELKAIHSKSPSLVPRSNGTNSGETPRPFMAALKATVGEE